jgi:hypothetical protein
VIAVPHKTHNGYKAMKNDTVFLKLYDVVRLVRLCAGGCAAPNAALRQLSTETIQNLKTKR